MSAEPLPTLAYEATGLWDACAVGFESQPLNCNWGKEPGLEKEKRRQNCSLEVARVVHL
jgi:hypothetical protein